MIMLKFGKTCPCCGVSKRIRKKRNLFLKKIVGFYKSYECCRCRSMYSFMFSVFSVSWDASDDGL